MRIVTGILKGRTIPFNPRRQGPIRLTPSRLKEAVFTMLGADLEDQSFLDLCAGCGQIGLEAYSRGARVTLNEPDQRRHAHLRALLQQWGLNEIELHRVRAQSLIPRLEAQQRPFHIAYLDPPYRATLGREPLSLALLRQLGHSGLLAEEGLVFVQHQKELDLPPDEGRLCLLRQRPCGQTTLSIYQH